MLKDASNRCTSTRDSGGLAGTAYFTEPAECTTISTTTKDPSQLIPDATIRKIISDVTTGLLTEASLQEVFTKDLLITDIFVEVIGQASSDGEKGRIQITITVTSTRTKDEIIADVNKALSKRLSISITFITSSLEKTDAAVARKRALQGTYDTYLLTSDLSTQTPTPPGNSTTPPYSPPYSGFDLTTPVWIFSILSLLFLRR
jgi:hypothetical protein